MINFSKNHIEKMYIYLEIVLPPATKSSSVITHQHVWPQFNLEPFMREKKLPLTHQQNEILSPFKPSWLFSISDKFSKK